MVMHKYCLSLFQGCPLYLSQIKTSAACVGNSRMSHGDLICSCHASQAFIKVNSTWTIVASGRECHYIDYKVLSVDYYYLIFASSGSRMTILSLLRLRVVLRI